MGHISFGITPFDPDQVKAELEKRGLTASVDTGGRRKTFIYVNKRLEGNALETIASMLAQSD